MLPTGMIHLSVARAMSTVDRAALPVMFRLFLSGEAAPSSPAARALRERALEIYGSEDLLANPRHFHREPPAPAIEVRRLGRLPKGVREHYRWRSGYRTWAPEYQADFDGYVENAVVHAECFRHDEPAPLTVICLHSWATAQSWLVRQAFVVERIYRAGFDVVIPMLPFHGPRTPKTCRFGGELFPSTMPLRTNEGFGQAVWDVRSLIRWLERRTRHPIGVTGMSLGGYLSAALAWVEPKLGFSVPIIPMVSLADLLWDHGQHHSEMHRLREQGLTLPILRTVYAVHSPLTRPPLIPHERRMIIGATGDRVCHPEHVRLLFDHWGRPRTHWFPGSHIAHVGRGSAFAELIRFLNDMAPTGA